MSDDIKDFILSTLEATLEAQLRAVRRLRRARWRRRDHAGLQLITHANGDRANHVILDFYERLERDDGPRDRRRSGPRHCRCSLPSDGIEMTN